MFDSEDIEDLRGEAEGAMPDSITIEPYVSQNAYGKPTYGTPTTIACLIQSYGKMIRLDNGQEVVASTKIMTPHDTVVNTKSRLTLPDGSHPLILKVDGLVQSEYTITVDIYT